MKRWLCAFATLMIAGSAWAQTKGAVPATRTETAIFAGGCFWCIESDFDKIDGVVSTTSGYIGGRKANPTYQEVSSGSTGHTEAVKVEFDPARVSYAQLLEKFWPTIDPTVKDQQFCDVGSQYRTGIYPINDAQLKAAQASKAALERVKPFNQPVVTEIVLAGTFYPAEEYHQDYYLKNPIRYGFYRKNCGRDARLKQLWRDKAAN
jgi:peptide-methionine (S)-S-oxide reductase